MTRARQITILLFLSALAANASGQSDAAPVPWDNSFWIWQTHAGEARPWREDPRLRDRFTESGFQDDLQVVFLNPDSAQGGQHEIMWVRIIAYAPRADRFLGILLNEPKDLRGVVQYDNVSFRWDRTNHWPAAIGVSGRYASIGWPRGALADSFRSTLIRGIRAYRSGANGHNMPGIERCIATLDSLGTANLPGATQEERFLLYFVLGRCLAEKYETVRAIRQFKLALEVAPDSVDPHMALLAEYSVIAHLPQAKLTEGTEAEWEHVFLAQLALVRIKFGANDEITRILDWVFDERNGGNLSGLPPAQLAKLRRVGWAMIRWKQR